MRKKVDWKELPDGYDKYKAYIKSDEWNKVREVVLERFNHHCAFCGRTEKLSIHHNTYDCLYNELEHLDCVIPLCSTCHLAGHRVKANYSRFKKPKKE